MRNIEWKVQRRDTTTPATLRPRKSTCDVRCIGRENDSPVSRARGYIDERTINSHVKSCVGDSFHDARRISRIESNRLKALSFLRKSNAFAAFATHTAFRRILVISFVISGAVKSFLHFVGAIPPRFASFGETSRTAVLQFS